MPRIAGIDDPAGGHLQRGEQRGGAVATVVIGLFSGIPGRIGSIGAVRSSAWIWDFSSTESTTALSGGFRYKPTTSRTLASSSGSVENLNVSDRHGCRPHLRQIVPTHTCEIPNSAPSNREDQCVIPSRCGGGSNVADTTATSSTCWGRPDFGRSVRPPIPSAA